MSYIEASKTLYESRLRTRYGPARGCWLWTIHRLERQLGCRLPAAYREFLRWTGAHHPGPFVGSEWRPSQLARNAAWLPELLAENHLDFQLPTRLLVFFFHGGAAAAWFSLPSVEADPPIWKFYEGSMQHPEQVGTFSQWLLDYLTSVAEGFERWPGDT